MALALLAKDSIQDLEALGREAENAETPRTLNNSDLSSVGKSLAASKKKKIALQDDLHPLPDASDNESSIRSIISDGSESSTTVGGANPQQAQDDDFSSTSGPGGAISAVFNSLTSSSRTSEPAVTPALSYGQYSGFRADYDEYQDDFKAARIASYANGGTSLDSFNTYYSLHDTYSPVYLGEGKQTKNCWQCIFPWMTKKKNKLESVSYENENVKFSEKIEANSGSISGESEDDAISTNSDVLGEKLSQKERQAVLARLGLAQPDSGAAGIATGSKTESESNNTVVAAGSPACAFTEKGLLNGIPTYDTTPLNVVRPIRGILKNRQSSSSVMPKVPTRKDDNKPRRRSLFPSSYDTSSRKVNSHVSFAAMARVVTVKSKNDMSPEEKGDIWWQKSDYEDFRRTGRIITRAMLEGGSEIWLQGSASTKGLKKRSADENDDPLAVTDLLSSPGDKWWHRFGHSRRGLEHVVSFDEGRQRQMNVRTAIQAILEEQERQRRYRKEDPEKLRIVSLNNTSWARDLALASGESDADAVRSSFAEDRKSREFFLLKIARSSPGVSCRRIPEFMQPVLRTGKYAHNRAASTDATLPGGKIRLDIHTASQIRFRHEQSKENDTTTSDDDIVSCEPVRDSSVEKKNSSMAQRGKGFSAEGDDKVDMAAVLSGMGPISASTISSSSSTPLTPHNTESSSTSLAS